MQKRRSSESGQSLVLLGCLIVVLVAVLGLAVDVGLIVLRMHVMQTAVDLAALAGAQEFWQDTGRQAEVATQFGVDNGLRADGITVTADTAQKTVEVDATEQVHLVLMPILGIHAGQVHVTAVAQAKVDQAGVFNYALFSAAPDHDLRMPGSYNVVDGKSHLNRDLIIPGSYNSFNNDCEVVGNLTVHATNNFAHLIHPANYKPISQFNKDEFRKKATIVYDHSVGFTDVLLNGIMYVDGDVHISGSRLSGKGTIVATGSIEISGSKLLYQSVADFMGFFALGHIALPGSDGTVDGIWYAPQGEIRVPGSRNTFHGSLIAQFLSFSGSNNHIVYDSRAKTMGAVSVGLIR